MTAAEELHNQLSDEFIRVWCKRLIETDKGGTTSILVLLESMIAGTGILLCKLDGYTPQKASILLEECLHQALRRMAEEMNQ